MQWLLHSTILAAGAVAADGTASAGTWARGDFGRLVVNSDASMTFQFGGVSLAAAAPNGTNGIKPGIAGTDARLGDYDELLLPAGAAGGFAIRYFARLDAFLEATDALLGMAPAGDDDGEANVTPAQWLSPAAFAHEFSATLRDATRADRAVFTAWFGGNGTDAARPLPYTELCAEARSRTRQL